MILADKIKKIIGVVYDVVEKDPDLSEAVIPALTAMITSVVESQLLEGQSKEKYIYTMRGYANGGKSALVSVDFDIIPLLQHLEKSGHPEMLATDIIPLAKFPEEDNKPEVLH